MSTTRRAFAAGAGSAWLAAALPARAAGPVDPASVRAALDAAAAAAAEGEPARALDRLAGFDGAALPPSLRLDLLTARAGLQVDVALAARFPASRRGKSPYRVTPTTGAWKRGATADADAIDVETAAIGADARAGVILPAPLLARTIAALGADRDEVPPPIAAAIARQRAALAALAPLAPVTFGIGALPGGREGYALLLRRHLGDDVTPARAGRRLLAEQHRLATRADALFDRLRLPAGTTGARFTALFADPRHLYGDDAAGRDRAVADMNRVLAAARARVPDEIGHVPSYCLDVATTRLSAVDEAAGRQGYRVLPHPAQPGAYVADLRFIRRRPSWTLPSVVHHELLPGHMIQLPMEEIARPHPLRLDYIPAFPEGWAIYAEALALRGGAYAADPLAELGALHWLMFRVGRALVDLHIHLRGMPLAAARAQLEGRQGPAAYFAPYDTDLERIATEPATRAAEALIWLALADAAPVGAAPALRSFHQTVLRWGRRRVDQLPA